LAGSGSGGLASAALRAAVGSAAGPSWVELVGDAGSGSGGAGILEELAVAEYSGMAVAA